MSDQTIYSGAIGVDGRPIAEGGASGQGGTFALRLAGLSPAAIDYAARVLALSPIAYYQLNGDALDSSGNGYDGTATGATFGAGGIGDGNTAAAFDGTGGSIDISAMAGAFDGNAGTLLLWGQAAAAVWSDGTTRYLARLAADASNLITISRTPVNNQIQVRRNASATGKFVSSTALAGTEAPFCVAVTWDTGAGQMKAYINGAQVGATQSNIGTFGGALSAAAIGALSTAGASCWSGSLAHVALFDRALSGADVLSLGVL